MNVGALAAWGMPPMGLGVFARDDIEEGPSWRHVAVNASRTDRRAQADRAHELGADVWTFLGPDKMAPDNWREGLATHRARRAELGAIGAICEFEDDWPHANEDEVTAYGEALRELALETRVIVTYFPGVGRLLAALARACGLGVVGMVQMHGLSSTAPATLARWWSESVSVWGLRLCLAIAGWRSSELTDTPEEFDGYLRALPKCSSAFVWPIAGASMPGWMVDALRGYEPGGSALGTVLEATLRTVVRPAFGVLCLFVVLLALLLLAVWRLRAAH